jgi:tRNA uridine 5-carboxymethylaminomethyl modification enzyme
MGLVDDARWASYCTKREAVSRETERLKSTWVNPRNLSADESERVLGKAIEHEHNLFDLLRRPNVAYDKLVSMDAGRFVSQDVSRETLGVLSEAVIEQVEISAKYSGYIDRQKTEVERASHFENLRLPAKLDYLQVSALSIEARQKLDKHRPETLGMASRISGITPATISLLLIHLKRGGFKEFMVAKPELVEGAEGLAT